MPIIECTHLCFPYPVIDFRVFGLSSTLLVFAGTSFSGIPSALLTKMVDMLYELHLAVNIEHRFGGLGGPWEFNLRDLIRWCHLMTAKASTNQQ